MPAGTPCPAADAPSSDEVDDPEPIGVPTDSEICHLKRIPNDPDAQDRDRSCRPAAAARGNPLLPHINSPLLYLQGIGVGVGLPYLPTSILLPLYPLTLSLFLAHVHVLLFPFL